MEARFKSWVQKNETTINLIDNKLSVFENDIGGDSTKADQNFINSTSNQEKPKKNDKAFEYYVSQVSKILEKSESAMISIDIEEKGVEPNNSVTINVKQKEVILIIK